MVLSTVWIFYVLNSAYGDITTLYPSGYLHPASTVHDTPVFVLFGALIVEPAILMVLFSRTLSNPANRWADLIVGGLLTVVNLATLLIGTPTPAYAFITALMIAAGIAIVWVAWNWVDLAPPQLEPVPGGTAPTSGKPIDVRA